MLKKAILQTLILVMLLPSASFALQCQPYKTNAEAMLSANGKQAFLYLIQNTTSSELLLNHSTGAGMQAGWASKLAAKQWSALLVTSNNFNLTCLQGSVSNCKAWTKFVVCHYPGQANGSFWLAENMAKPSLLQTIKTRLTEGK